MKKEKKLIWTSILTAIGASLCCITPILALISGASGIASTFSWLEPARPYLIIITICVLGFAWFQKLKPEEEIDCNCDDDKNPSFIQSKPFLGIVTCFALLMLLFPYYGNVFYPEVKKEMSFVNKSDLQYLDVSIEGMTCTSCENHVNHSVNELNGIIEINTFYKNGIAKIEFDKSKTTVEEIEKAINSTGYKITNIKKK